ncbi:MAG: DUF4388 domain-containing protein [Deltaproteobacteria bacterium]|nr:DUF4388 domain-containing protein [Deltaproteobacteria bacterium]
MKKIILAINSKRVAHRNVRTALAPSGHTVIAATSAQEGLAIARRIRPSLIFLSYHLPGGSAVNFLHKLSELPLIRNVPVVLTSEEDGVVPEDVTRSRNVVDQITFPIEPDALLTLTKHLFEKYKDQGLEEEKPGEEITQQTVTRPVALGEEALPEEYAKRHDSKIVMPKGKASPKERMKRAFAAAMAAQFGKIKGLPSSRHAARWMYELAERVLEAEYVPARDTGEESRDSALRGDLGAIPVAEILQLLALQRQTGSFNIVHKSADISIYFDKGIISICQARNLSEEFLLGRYLVQGGWISREDLELLLASRKGTKKMLGQQLIRLGYLTNDQLEDALAKQSAEVVYEALRWSDGFFFFRAGEKPPKETAELKLSLRVDTLLMEGFRRVDEWRLIQKEIRKFDQVFEKDEGRIKDLTSEKLTMEERRILKLINGKNSVRSIVKKSNKSSFEASKILYRLLSMHLIRPVEE